MTAIQETGQVSQPMQALARANDVRIRQAEVKRAVKEGRTTAAHVIMVADRHSPLATLKVVDVLRSQHRWGKVKAHKLMRVLGIDSSRTLGALTTRQRHVIAYELDPDHAAD